MVENMETCSIIILLYLFFLGVIFLSIVDLGCCVGFRVQHSVLLLRFDYRSSVHHNSCRHLAKQIINCCPFLNLKSNRILGRVMNLSSGCLLNDQINWRKSSFWCGGDTQRSAY